jgi:hypothetical protein
MMVELVGGSRDGVFRALEGWERTGTVIQWAVAWESDDSPMVTTECYRITGNRTAKGNVEAVLDAIVVVPLIGEPDES